MPGRLLFYSPLPLIGVCHGPYRAIRWGSTLIRICPALFPQGASSIRPSAPRSPVIRQAALNEFAEVGVAFSRRARFPAQRPRHARPIIVGRFGVDREALAQVHISHVLWKIGEIYLSLAELRRNLGRTTGHDRGPPRLRGQHVSFRTSCRIGIRRHAGDRFSHRLDNLLLPVFICPTKHRPPPPSGPNSTVRRLCVMTFPLVNISQIEGRREVFQVLRRGGDKVPVPESFRLVLHVGQPMYSAAPEAYRMPDRG